jgi:transposase-like protein
MIRFLISRGHGYTLECLRKTPQAPATSLMTYDRLLRSRWLRRATYVFADIDRLSFWDLELTAHSYLEMKRLGLRVLNNPATVKTRYALLRALHRAGLNDFNVYRADEINSSIRFPVFLKKNQMHDAPLTDLLHSVRELENAIAAAANGGTPMENLVVTEFAAEPVQPGVYRKLSAFRIGDLIVPAISVHDAVWLIKYGQLGIAGEDLYRDELKLLQTNPFAGHLRKAFEIAAIEYGRADFGIYKGCVQIYEINTNPSVGSPAPHPFATRRESMRLCWETYLEALRGLDSGGGWPVRLPNGTLQRRRVRANLFVRTRKTA